MNLMDYTKKVNDLTNGISSPVKDERSARGVENFKDTLMRASEERKTDPIKEFKSKFNLIH